MKRFKLQFKAILLTIVLCLMFTSLTLAEPTIVEIIGQPVEQLDEVYLNSPVALSKDSLGNIYVADMGNHRIVKFNDNGNIIGKYGIRGSGIGEFDTPFGVAIDNDDSILVADTANYRIQKFDSDFNYITQWGSEGSGNGQFGLVREIAIDSQNRYHVCDEFHDRIQVFDQDGEFLFEYGERGTQQAQFMLPQGIAIKQSVSGDMVYICDTFNNRVQVLDSNGNYLTQLGTGEAGDTSTKFRYPRGVNIDSNGDVYIADTFNHKIKVYDSNHSFLFSTSLGIANLEPAFPCQVLPIGNQNFVVSDTGNSRLQIRNETSILTRVGNVRADDYIFSGPSSIALDEDNNYYVSDSMNHRILKYNSYGQLISKWGGNSGNGGTSSYGNFYWQFTSPKQVSYDSAFGRILIADTGNSRIQVFSTSGNWISNFGYAVFSLPMGVCSDSYGNIYISDTGNNRIMKCSPYGITLRTWGTFGTGNGQFNMPAYLTVDSEDNIYVVDRNNSRIQKFDSNGNFITKWGTHGGNSLSHPLDNWGIGDNDLFLPVGIACDEDDKIYVTDSSNNRVQVFDSSGVFIESFGAFSGSSNGFFSPQGIAVNQTHIYITDALLNRISVFEK